MATGASASPAAAAAAASEHGVPIIPGSQDVDMVGAPKTEPEATWDKPDDFEQSFWDALVGQVPIGLLKWMYGENIRALEDLPCYVPDQAQIPDLIINACPATRNQRKFLVPISKLWLAAKASMDLGVKRQAEGVTDADLEVPLSQEEVDALNSKTQELLRVFFVLLRLFVASPAGQT